MSKIATRLRLVWERQNLSRQFAMLASVLIGIAMTIIGTWVSSEIEQRVLQQIAVSRAIYLESFISPFSQDLAHASDLGPAAKQSLSHLLAETPFGRQVVSVKIWAPGGRIVYSSNPKIIGKLYPLSDRLAKAYEGQVSVQIEEPDDEEHEFERLLKRPLFELYAPVREHGTDRIIAVAELYEIADQLKKDMRRAGMQSWLIVGFISLGMIGALYSIVRRGSHMIGQQREALVDKVAELSRLLAENRGLQDSIRSANEKATTENEHFLRRVGADLHDGPAQLISLALLLQDGAKAGCAKIACARIGQRADEFDRVGGALSDALDEIRTISAGLAPPELERVTPAAAIQFAVHLHERRTGTAVQCGIGELPKELSLAVKIGLYRFVQEGLNNAFKHAGGRGQLVRARREDDSILVEVEDKGPGLPLAQSQFPNSLGLAGLRARVESIGGRLELQSEPESGTRLAARFKLAEGIGKE